MMVVADTSPINYLVLIEEIGLLQKLFKRIVIPDAVWSELAAPGSPAAVKAWANEMPDWVRLMSPKILDASITLGPGDISCSRVECGSPPDRRSKGQARGYRAWSLSNRHG